jgi:hypothetical protein
MRKKIAPDIIEGCHSLLLIGWLKKIIYIKNNTFRPSAYTGYSEESLNTTKKRAKKKANAMRKRGGYAGCHLL